MKKISFTSLIAMFVVAPAMAIPSISEFNFTGLMEEDRLYIDSGTYENTGTYDEDIIAEAEYDWQLINCPAGKYLPQSSTSTATCTAGNFCPGISNIHYDEDKDQGITACSTLDDGSYTNSASGATSESGCYKSCTVADVPHSATVSGDNYYGDGNDTCEALTCVNGYHKENAVPDTLINYVQNATAEAHVSPDGTTTSNAATYGLTSSDKNLFVIDYGNAGKLGGRATCNDTVGDNNNSKWFNPTTIAYYQSPGDSTNYPVYCYCQLTDYTPLNGNLRHISAPWVFYKELSTSANCQSTCTAYCANALRYTTGEYLAFREAMFKYLPKYATCEGNNINVTWTGTTTEAVNENRAGQFIYGGEIRTPKSALPPATGKKFKGWRFIKPSQQSGGGQ